MKDLIKKILNVKTRRKILEFLNRTWCALCRLLPVKNRVLFFTIRADGRLLENSKAVYDAVDADKVIFAHMLPHSNKTKALAYYYLLTSRVIVTDDYVRYMRVIKLRKEQKLIQIWHACGAFKCFGLDAPSALTEKEERRTHSQYSAVTVSSESCRKHYASAFGVSEDICLPLGVPRTDMLLDESNAAKMREEIYSKHPELKGKTVYLYCPTFREADGKKITFDSGIDFEQLSADLGENEVFVIRRHPVMNYKLTDREYKNIPDLTDCSTLALTAICNVLITDYSSVIYDASLLGKPMVFYCPDYDIYERNFYLDFETELPGKLVKDGAELLKELRRANNETDPAETERFRKEQMGACDGKSTERIKQLVLSYLN